MSGVNCRKKCFFKKTFVFVFIWDRISWRNYWLKSNDLNQILCVNTCVHVYWQKCVSIWELQNWIFNFNYIFIYLKSRSGLSLLIWFFCPTKWFYQICPVWLRTGEHLKSVIVSKLHNFKRLFSYIKYKEKGNTPRNHFTIFAINF